MSCHKSKNAQRSRCWKVRGAEGSKLNRKEFPISARDGERRAREKERKREIEGAGNAARGNSAVLKLIMWPEIGRKRNRFPGN